MGVWDGYTGGAQTQGASVRQPVQESQKSTTGGLGALLYSTFIDPVVQSTLSGGRALTELANTGNIKNKKKFAADIVNTGTAVVPLGKAKSAVTGSESVLSKLWGGAKVGAGAGAVTGAATSFGNDETGSEIADSALSGAGFGALGGALGSGAGALLGRAVRGKTPKMVNAPTEPASVLEVSPSKIGTLLQDKGLQVKARAGGYGVGEKVAGAKSLGWFDSAKVDENLTRRGIKLGAPASRLKAVEVDLKGLGRNIDEAVKQNNANLPMSSQGQILSDYLTAIENQPGANPSVSRAAKNFAINFARQAKDTKSLIAFRRGLDDQSINFVQNPDAKLAADQLAARVFRNVLSEHTGKLVPGIKSLNADYHDMVSASEFLKGGAREISNQSQSDVGSLVGRALSSETAQSVKSRAGDAMQRLGNKLNESAAPSNTSVGAGINLGPAFARLTGASAGIGSEEPSLATSQTPMQLPSGSGVGSPADSKPVQSIYSQEAMIADIRRDPENASDYQSLYKILNPASSSKAVTPGYGKPTAQQYAQGTSGLQSISQLEQMLQNDPGVLGRNATPGQYVPLVGSLESGLLGTSDYRAVTHNILNSIARINTGAAMPNSEEGFYRQTYLPQPGDDERTIQTKIENLKAFFIPVTSYPGSDGSASESPSYADNTELLSALSGR